MDTPTAEPESSANADSATKVLQAQECCGLDTFFLTKFQEDSMDVFYGTKGLKSIVFTRVIYDRVRNGKNYFEIPAFLPIERGISRMGKFKLMLHFAATEMCLFLFLFSFEFPALEVPRSKFKKVAISI